MHYIFEADEELKRNGSHGGLYKYCTGVITPMVAYATDAYNQVAYNVADVLKVYFYPHGCRKHT
jgi:hypothetical protein